jgi:putative tryptophan/tyrosine transport system substrate-binding protein
VSRVAALWHPGAYGEQTMEEADTAATDLGIQLRLVDVGVPDDLDDAFSKIPAGNAEAVMVFPSPMLLTERRRIVELAAKHRLPSMSVGREFVQLGGLLSYGANITEMHRQIATYVDRILKGAKPAELPVQQPNKFDLAINLKTAQRSALPSRRHSSPAPTR